MNFTPQWLSNPEIIHKNRLDAHSDHRAYAPHDDPTTPHSSYELTLDGTWDFHYYPTFTDVPTWDALHTLPTWEPIRVPGHLQTQGYDRNRYCNIQYPWDGWETLTTGQAPTTHNPVGIYKRHFTFTPPTHTTPHKHILRFDGAESALSVWLNGTWIGYSTDSFTPSEFDITPHLNNGDNTLIVAVFMWNATSWIEDQDFFRFAGLHRSVTLITQPQHHLEHLHTTTHITNDHTQAHIRINYTTTPHSLIHATLSDNTHTYTLTHNPDTHTLETTINNPQLWSAENPYLYTLTITISTPNNTPTEIIREHIGIRSIEIRNSTILLNGKRLIFNGVNRHEFGPDGRVVSPEMTTRDLHALKAIGVNAVRTSHYPNSRHFYHECDRLGLYVIDEMNLEAHAQWDRIVFNNLPPQDAIPGDSPQWLPTLLDRARSMQRRDINHPCILMWSCGNESYGGTNLLKVAQYFRENDTRPIHYEGTYWDPRYPETTDVFSSMYVPAADIEHYLTTHRDKPYIVCEYAHAMGNSFGAVHKYIQLTRHDPLFHGGFIWDFSDQAVRARNTAGNEYWAYGGDSGEAPHDAEFCGNGIFFADHTPTPKIQEVRALYAPFTITITESTIHIDNHLLFTSSDTFNCQIRLDLNGQPLHETTIPTSIAPGESGTYPLPETILNAIAQIPATSNTKRNEIALTVSFHYTHDTPWAPAHHEVAFGQNVFHITHTNGQAPQLHPIPTPGSPQAQKLISTPPTINPPHTSNTTSTSSDNSTPPGLRLVNGIHNIGVHGENFSILFSKIYAGPTSYRHGTGPHREQWRQLLTSPIRPCFWHAPTSNEKGWNSAAHDGQWLLASRYAHTPAATPHPVAHPTNDSIVITYNYTLPTTPPSTATMTYAVYPDGRINVTTDVTPGDGLNDMPEFGVLFATDPALRHVTWYGDGPDECYVDRRHGARLGTYSSTVTQLHTPYLRPQESGNHTGVRWATVLDDTGKGLRIENTTHDFGMEFSAQPWNPFEIENARHDHELPPQSYTWLRPALMRRGVGGDNSWGARTHPEYCLPAGVPLRFSFSFQGIGA